MRFYELFEKAQGGTYVAVKFDEDTNDAIMAFIEENGIPNPIDKSDLHCTIVHSVKTIPWSSQEEIDEEAEPIGFHVWDTWNGKSKCLVMRIESKYLESQYKHAESIGAVSDFDDYKAHITLSYDVSDFDVSKLEVPDIKIRIIEEYSEPLNKNT